MIFVVRYECAAGHSQRMTYGEGFTEDMVHDHAAMMCGGTLRSIGAEMPGYPCAWGDGGAACGAKTRFLIESVTNGVR